MHLLTTGEIARRLNVDRDVVSYAIRKLRIKPVSIAGNVRIFSRETLVAVQRFLESKVDSHSNTKKIFGGIRR